MKRIEHRREHYRQELEKAKIQEIYDAKFTFFTNVSHELFTPITFISCSLDKLSENNTHDSKLYLLMRSNLNRLMRLLQQILEFRKADSANLKLRVSEENITAFVRQMCDENFISIDDRNIELIFSSDPDPITGYFDTDKLDKIMYNLISNAFKYNRKEGKVFVSLSLSGNHHVQIEVRDTGYGIEPEHLGDIFNRFYEGEYRKFKTKGTGIGLSLTKELVQLHNGTIDVDSEIGKGTVFTVVLPVDRAAYADDQIENPSLLQLAAIADLSEKPSGPLKGHHTILLVEDNKELLDVMQNIMGDKYETLTARDGIEALEVLRNNYVDLMISDYLMPNMNGVELCRAVRSDVELCHIPIIMLSVYSSKEHKLESFDAGADSYLTKPFDTSILSAQVDSIIENRNRMKSNFQKSTYLDMGQIINIDLDRQFLDKIIHLIKENLFNPDFGNENLCAAIHMSNSTLYRKIKSMTGRSPQEFVRNVRFKIACEMLLEKSTNISEVAYRLGYGNAKYFSTCFRKEFGMSPREFIKANLKLHENSLDPI